MKAGAYILLLFALLASPWAHSQVIINNGKEISKATDLDFPRSYFILKTNPLAVAWGVIPLTSELRVVTETVFDRHFSSELSASLLLKSPILAAIEDTASNDWDLPLTVNGFRLQATPKIYLSDWLSKIGIGKSKLAPEGLYIAPHVSYATAKFSDRFWNRYNVYLRISHFNANLRGGYQHFINDRFTFDWYVASGYKDNWWVEKNYAGNLQSIDPELGSFYASNFSFFIGFNFGWAID